MDKWKYTEIFDLKWEISLKDMSISYWWKYEGESFKMVQSRLDESNGYINEKKNALIYIEGRKKCRGR